MKEDVNSGDHIWEESWEDHNRLQLRRLADLPLADKLVWLEEAQRLVLHLSREAGHPSTNDTSSSGRG